MVKILTDARTVNSLIRQGAVEKIRESVKYFNGDYVESVISGDYLVGKTWYSIAPKYLDGCFKPYVLGETCNWKHSRQEYFWLDKKDVKVPTYMYKDFYNLWHVGIGNPDDKIELPSTYDCISIAERNANAMGNGNRLECDYSKDGVYVEVKDDYYFEKYKNTIKVPSMSLGIFR
jgi:hypothetical protein